MPRTDRGVRHGRPGHGKGPGERPHHTGGKPYAGHPSYFGSCADGLQPLVVAELRELGVPKVRHAFRGVYFDAEPEQLCRAVYGSRLLNRIYAPLQRFECFNEKQLHAIARELPWEDLMGLKDRLAIQCDVADSNIRHSLYAAQVLKDAICDRFRDRTGKRPSVDLDNPDICYHLRVFRNRAVISLDLGGGPLFRRGWRTEMVPAPMQESVAAAIVMGSGWDGSTPLYDPFCGSGTILGEAFMRQARIPAGYLRKKWGIDRLPAYDEKLWNKVKADMDAQIRPVDPTLIAGSDRSPKAVQASRDNLRHLPGGDVVHIRGADYADLPPMPGATILTNPPWGVRLDDPEEAAELAAGFGDWLKQSLKGGVAWVYFGAPEPLRALGLRAERTIPLRSGNVDGRLAKIPVFAPRGA